MSSIEIVDLDPVDTNLRINLANTEICHQIIGGGRYPVTIGGSNSSPISISTSSILPSYSNATSISIANATRSGAIVTTLNTNFNTNLTLNPNNRQPVSGSIGITIDIPH
jgi:hypothetical protein